jgi:hypothetical protein
MADEGPKLHPHIFAPQPAKAEPFTSPRTGREKHEFPRRGRRGHADRLLAKLAEVEPVAKTRVEEQKAEGIDEGNGITVIFESSPGFDLKFESLDFQPSGIELCAVRKLPSGEMQAAVFVPDGKLGYFLNKITAYRNDNTRPSKSGKTRPKNEDLVASIADIRLAALQALWTDTPELFPDAHTPTTFEVWLRRGPIIDHVARLRQYAERFGLTLSPLEIQFIDRTILLVHGTAEDLSRSNDILGMIAEVRLAKTAADFFTRMSAIEQQALVDNLKARCTPPAVGAPYVCLLDTGLNRGHALLTDVTQDDDLHTYNPNWGVVDIYGHGTPMAGLVVYGDLTAPLTSTQAIALTHRVESVKFFNENDPHAAELYGAVTAECVSRVEVKPDRKRVYCLAITASDTRDRGRPSSWSAAIDAMAAGYADEQQRLIIIAAGNTVTADRGDYPASNMTDSVHDPAQSWNALTIGGMTDKANVDQRKYAGWRPLAAAGDLSPCSCTSVTWTDGRWPIKPDLVLEAGNMARHDDYEEPDYIDDALSLLSTPHNFGANKPLVTFGDTSAATALASRMAAMVWAKYPNLTPEAVRALMIHSAEWTPIMINRSLDDEGKLDQTALVRCFGFGAPNLQRLLSSAGNSLTLIAQGSIQPFYKDEGGGIKTRELKLHELPWPRETLEGLQETEVKLRVTLSYFVEPNPGARGWSTKYGYQSHGLRFDVKRATENLAQFQERINKAARDEDYEDDPHKETGAWQFKSNQSLSALGSVRSNVWTGKAADLATRGYIAVYPTYGWWNKRPNLLGYEKSSHYALIATISTPETDIYTPVATAINVPIVIET